MQESSLSAEQLAVQHPEVWQTPGVVVSSCAVVTQAVNTGLQNNVDALYSCS